MGFHWIQRFSIEEIKNYEKSKDSFWQKITSCILWIGQVKRKIWRRKQTDFCLSRTRVLRRRTKSWIKSIEKVGRNIYLKIFFDQIRLNKIFRFWDDNQNPFGRTQTLTPGCNSNCTKYLLVIIEIVEHGWQNRTEAAAVTAAAATAAAATAVTAAAFWHYYTMCGLPARIIPNTRRYMLFINKLLKLAAPKRLAQNIHCEIHTDFHRSALCMRKCV